MREEEQEASCWGSLRGDHAGREHAQPCLTPYEVCVTAQSEDCQKKNMKYSFLNILEKVPNYLRVMAIHRSTEGPLLAF